MWTIHGQFCSWTLQSLVSISTSAMSLISTYKLTYFDMRARGESIRLLFALVKIPYEEVRIGLDDWEKHKPNTPWGSLPILEVDGITLAQHCTIGRFLAKRFGLAGRDEVEQAKSDEVVDAVTDLLNEQLTHQVAIHLRSDEKKVTETRQNLIQVSIPNFFAKFEAILSSNGGNFIVNNQLTWADVWVANIVDRMEQCFDADIKWELYPNLRRAKCYFFDLAPIKEYVAKRSETQL